jgi:hypothetical protein
VKMQPYSTTGQNAPHPAFGHLLPKVAKGPIFLPFCDGHLVSIPTGLP